MKKYVIFPFLVLAIVLAACGTGNVNETPVGTSAATRVATSAATSAATTAATKAATSAATTAATSAATKAATSAGTKAATTAATAAATTQPTGLVAVPYSMFEVATLVGTRTGTAAGTATPAAAGTTAATAAATTSAYATTSPTTAAERTMVRATELIGTKVVDMKNATVGTILDVMADKAGAIQFIVLDASTYLGIGTGTGGSAAATHTPAAAGTTSATSAATTAATPRATTAATSAATTAATSAATTAATAAATTGALGTQTSGQIGMASKDVVLVFTGTQSELKTSGLPVDRKILDEGGILVDTSKVNVTMDAKLNGLIRVSKLTNFGVKDTKNDNLGDVKDVILDAQQGKVEYGVVDFGGFLGIGSQTVAVPWQRFVVNTTSGAAANADLTLDVNPDTLKNAPKLDLSKWPAWPQPLPTNWDTETRTFWQSAS